MRIAIGEFAHETNTFCAGVDPGRAFQARHWLTRRRRSCAQHRGVRDDLGGMIDAGERLGVELVPTFATSTEPSATISAAAYDQIRDELLSGIRAAGPIDAVCLSLHGAGVAEGIDDLEGTLLAEVRAVVGPDLPIVVTLDLHGNITQAMVDHADRPARLPLLPPHRHVRARRRGGRAGRARSSRRDSSRPRTWRRCR